jgi:cellulose biosynthesis protein BcsQ
MPDPVSFIRWLGAKWSTAGTSRKSGYLILVVVFAVGVGFLAQVVPGFDWLKELFSRARPEVQTSVLAVLATLAVIAGVWAALRNVRVTELKEDVGRLRTALDAAEKEVRHQQERMDHLLAVESRAGLWQRACTVNVPPFVPAAQRGTRFVTVLNLKGGVGKTTLTANLAASLAMAAKPHRVLLIDIDFQGTLGDAAVDKSLIEIQAQHQAFVNRLLLGHPAGDLLPRLTVPMCRVPNAKVILATDTLDTDEFHLQARFFLDPSADPRYQFRSHLHTPEVFAGYDLVVFDCPPRVTTSVVNAIVCSDYVLIPTRLDRGSIDAVPRTLHWLRSLGPVCPADVLGVVASHATVRDGKLTKADQQSHEYLRDVVQSQCGDDRVFKAAVPSTPRAIGPDRGLVAALTAEGRQVFAPVVSELVKRMH